MVSPLSLVCAGVVLYVVLAGCLPFDEPTLPGLFKQIMTASYEIAPWFSAEVKALLRRMLCVDPEKRITLAELARDPWVLEGGYTPVRGSMTPVGAQEAADIFDANRVQPKDLTAAAQMDLAGMNRGHSNGLRQNAFMLISAAIDLSGMFDIRKVPPPPPSLPKRLGTPHPAPHLY